MEPGEDRNRAVGDAGAAGPPRKKKPKKRREKTSIGSANAGAAAVAAAAAAEESRPPPPVAAPSSVTAPAGRESLGGGGGPLSKKQRKQGRRQNSIGSATAGGGGGGGGGGTTKDNAAAGAGAGGTAAPPDPAQQAVYDQMRRALEEDQYSAVGSIVDGTDSEEEDMYLYRGQAVRMDRAAMQQTAKKIAQEYWYPQPKSGLARHLINPEFNASLSSSGGGGAHSMNDDYDDDGDNMDSDERAKESMRSKKKRKKEGHPDSRTTGSSGSNGESAAGGPSPATGSSSNRELVADFLDPEEDMERDGGSIFGQTAGATNATWVECDKCKKWRRLRGVVDEKKLPPKWYCNMNRNDPERARCSAPEEDYDTQQTPESAADARTRKHLRVWVRRLQCQEAYEARQPTLTRGKKRAAANNSMKENGAAYEWIRCCNPSCGKWRALLRFMDAKTVMERGAKDGKEWYCVMNTWDEKMASCAAPQENLPAVGCPPWVLQDGEES